MRLDEFKTRQNLIRVIWDEKVIGCKNIQQILHMMVKANNCTVSTIMFVCLIVVFRPTREFFTHMETSSLPVKGCKFWLILGSQYRLANLSRAPWNLVPSEGKDYIEWRVKTFQTYLVHGLHVKLKFFVSLSASTFLNFLITSFISSIKFKN